MSADLFSRHVTYLQNNGAAANPILNEFWNPNNATSMAKIPEQPKRKFFDDGSRDAQISQSKSAAKRATQGWKPPKAKKTKPKCSDTPAKVCLQKGHLQVSDINHFI